MKDLKESLYLLSHPTSIGSWFLMWIFCAVSIFLINMTIYQFDPVEDMMSIYIKSMVIFTISSIHVHRKLFMNAFKKILLIKINITQRMQRDSQKTGLRKMIFHFFTAPFSHSYFYSQIPALRYTSSIKACFSFTATRTSSPEFV